MLVGMDTKYEEDCPSNGGNSCQGLNSGNSPSSMKDDIECDGNNEECDSDMELKDRNSFVGIAVNGIEDIAGINLKRLTTEDLMKYHFPNLAVAFTFYNWYARIHGFSARKSKVRRNKDKEVIQQNFVCYRQGFREDKFKDKQRKREPRADTRCGCEAKIIVHVDYRSHRWYIRYFNDVHNHQFVEDDFVGFLPGHRGMDDDDILQMQTFRKSGIGTSQVYGSLASQCGGFKNVTFSIQDMYNEVDKDRRSKGTDSRAALAYLRSIKSGDPSMYWKHTIDKAGRLEHLFWCDGRSQMDYAIFGDVLAFDATYKKNRYLCPLVIFSGVNHHNQTTVFATAIVANESEETYVWLLETLLEVMQGKIPISVITDGDLAMRNAIKRVFPKAHHRLCAWHLIRNATSNVNNSRFTSLFRKCMLCDYEIIDFERKWNEMVAEFGIQDNRWVLDLYAKKDMWAAAHIRGKFFGGFRTTSRCEALHAKIGRFVNFRNNLAEFLQHYSQCLEYLRFKELEADFLSMHGDRVLLTEFHSLEKSASKLYTKNIFFLFRSVMKKASAMKVIGCKQTASCFIYIVTKYCRSGIEWHVSYWPSCMEIKCSCLRMESIGIPCDHIVGVMVYLNMVELPSCLVLDRWTKNAKDVISCENQRQSGGWDSMTVCRYKSLNQRSRDVNSLACKCPEAYAETLELLNGHYDHVKTKYGFLPDESVNLEERNDHYLRNPATARTKGRGVGAKSKRTRKRRPGHCGLCNLVGHNRQTCPGLTNLKQKDGDCGTTDCEDDDEECDTTDCEDEDDDEEDSEYEG